MPPNIEKIQESFILALADNLLEGGQKREQAIEGMLGIGATNAVKVLLDQLPGENVWKALAGIFEMVRHTDSLKDMSLMEAMVSERSERLGRPDAGKEKFQKIILSKIADEIAGRQGHLMRDLLSKPKPKPLRRMKTGTFRRRRIRRR